MPAFVGTVRTGCYKFDASGDDGFTADIICPSGSNVTLANVHSADTRRAPTDALPNGALDLFELSRGIELYNYRDGMVRTDQYHVQAGSEDGFSPGL